MKYTFSILFLLLVSVSQAQSWKYGPKLDLNFSEVTGKGMKSGFTPGAQIGIFAQHPFNEQWSLQPELLYTLNSVRKGDDFTTFYNDNVGREAARQKIQLHAVSVPVLIRYEISDKFSLLAGPQYSYLFYLNENLLRSNADAFKRSVVSVNVGGQFNLGGFGVSVRYNRGLNDINNIDNRYSWKMDQIQVGFAVRISGNQTPAQSPVTP